VTGGPILFLDAARARAEYLALVASVAPIRLRYAVKANPHPVLLGALADAGAQFAVTSEGELSALQVVGVPGARIACVNPGPPASLLRACRAAGVRELVADAPWELRKAAALVPGAAVHLVLGLPPAGRLRYPAARPGLALDDLPALLAAARGLPVELCGVAFHVGSQCERLSPWRAGVALAARAWQQLEADGWHPRSLGLGGGVPVAYRRPVPRASSIARAVRSAVAAHFAIPPAEWWLEPGRAVAAPAGVLGATVLAQAPRRRGGVRLTLDVGRYHGLPEVALGIRYPCTAGDAGPPARCTLVGPLGPGRDLLDPAAWLPPLAPGDHVYFHLAGAYTAVQTAYPRGPAGPCVEARPMGAPVASLQALARRGVGQKEPPRSRAGVRCRDRHPDRADWGETCDSTS
jgi:ornithine decarboxylase